MQGASRLKQIEIYTRKYFRIFVNEKGWKIFISTGIIALIVSSVMNRKMFVDYSITRNGVYAIVCACILIGMFNSIQSICKERDIIRKEFRTGLHISSYVVSHMVFEMALCMIESIIFTMILCLSTSRSLPNTGVFCIFEIELMITTFLIIYSSDVLGLMISSIVKTINSAMMVLPIVFITQLVLSGMHFELIGFIKFLSKLTISKWGINSICIISNVNAMGNALPNLVSDYAFTIGHIAQIWLILIMYTLLYGVISIMILKLFNKEKR